MPALTASLSSRDLDFEVDQYTKQRMMMARATSPPSGSFSPSPSSRPALTASLSSRELDFDVDQYTKQRMMMARATSPPSGSFSPSPSSRPALTASLSSRELDFDADNQYARRMMMARANSPPDYSPDLVAAYVQALSSLQQQQQHQQHQQSSARSGSTKPPMGGLSARAAAFTNRSQTFVHRSPSPAPSLAPARSFKSPAPSSMLADWGSPDGKLDWGVQAAELRKSTSFGVRSSTRAPDATRPEDNMYSSWMNDGGSSDMLAARWSDLEQMVA